MPHLQTRPVLHLLHYNSAEWCYTYKPDQCYTSRITTSRSGATPTYQTSAISPALQQRGVVLHLQTRPVLHLPHYNLVVHTYKPDITPPALQLAEWCSTYKPDQCYTSCITTSQSGVTRTNQTSATPPALQPRRVVLHLQTRPVLHLPHYNSAEWCYTFKPDQCYTSRITTSRSGATPTNQTSATPPALQQRGVVLHLQTRPVLHLPHYNLAEWCYTYKPDQCYTSRIRTLRNGATPRNQTSATPPALPPRGVVLHLQTRPVLHLPHYNLAEWCYTYKLDQCYTSRITTARSGATPTNQTSATPPALQQRGVVLHLQTRPVLHLPHYNLAEWCYTYKPDQCYSSRITTSRSGATPTNQTSATPPALQQRRVVLHL